jgi:hypothetical protein
VQLSRSQRAEICRICRDKLANFKEDFKAWETKKKFSINGVLRTAAVHEPPFPTQHRRLSGIRLSSDKVGRIMRILCVGGETVAEVEIFTPVLHTASSLWIVDKNRPAASRQVQFMLENDLAGPVVMFVPFDHEGGDATWCVIDTVLH